MIALGLPMFFLGIVSSWTQGGEILISTLILGGAPLACGLTILYCLDKNYRGDLMLFIGLILVSISALLLGLILDLVMFFDGYDSGTLFWLVLAIFFTAYGSVLAFRRGSYVNSPQRHQLDDSQTPIDDRTKPHNHELSSSLPGQKIYFQHRNYNLQFSFRHMADEIDIFFDGDLQDYVDSKTTSANAFINGKGNFIEQTPYAFSLEDSIQRLGKDQLYGRFCCILRAQGKIVRQQCAVFPKQAIHKVYGRTFNFYNRLAYFFDILLFLFYFIFFAIMPVYLFSFLTESIPKNVPMQGDLLVELVVTAIVFFSYLPTQILISQKNFTAYVDNKMRPNLPYMEIMSADLPIPLNIRKNVDRLPRYYLWKGISFSFKDGTNVIECWFNGFTGLEKVSVNNKLVARQRSFSMRNSSISFNVQGVSYKTNIEVSNLFKGSLMCSLFKNGELFKQQKSRF